MLFQRNTICLPPDIAFQVHLLSQMNTHRGNELNMFNEVIWCVKAHAIHYIMDYKTLQILSRKQLVQLLTKYYQLNFLKPTLHSVPLTDGSVVTVPIFNVKALLIAFFNDPLRMRQENFASNYDIFTGKAKLPTSTLDDTNWITLGAGQTKILWWWSRCISPSTGLLLWQNKYWCIWFAFMRTIHLYTIILEQRLLQWWLKLHGFGLHPQSWI